MKSNKSRKSDGLFTSIFAAYTILILHLLLLAGLGLLVIFFGGLVQYLFWVFLGGMGLVGLSAYLFYRRLRQQGRSLREALRAPMFQGRAVEISFLGGIAELKLGAPQKAIPMRIEQDHMPLQLEDPETARIRDLAALAHLLEKNLITQAEFTAAKEKLFEK